MRDMDWSRTKLGPVETWPQSLRTAVGIMLSSRYAMFVWWGRDLVNLYNNSYRPFLGKKHPGAVGQSARDVWAEIWDLIGPRTAAVLERGESTFDEGLLLVMERYGFPEETYFTFSYSPIRDDRGDVGGIFCAVTDETSRVIGERRLKLLRDVAATAPDTHTLVQVCAAAASSIAGETRDLPFALLYLTEPGGRDARLVAQAGIQPGDKAAPLRIDLEAADAIWPLVKAKAAPLVMEDLASRCADLPTGAWDRAPDRAIILPLFEQGQQGIAGFLVAGLNPYLVFDEGYRGFTGLLAGQIAAGLANARAYEEERKRAEALAEIDRAKTAFFSNVSHEFRTPLTLMLSPLEDLLARSSTPDDTALVSAAHRNGLRLLKLVNALLDFSRIEAGRVQASYEPVELARFTAELASNFRSACDKAGLSLDVDCAPLNEPVYVDRDMWEKIVLNLLSNAFKFTFDGGITVQLRRDGDGVALTVRDTGTGVPAHEIPRLFERFHRVEGACGRTHEGTGIGLALVQELVKLHGGTVRADSTVGAGSTFTVTLPLGTAHLPPDRIRAAATPGTSAMAPPPYVEEALRWLPEGLPAATLDSGIERTLLPEQSLPALATSERATILLADDNADMRDYVRRLLGERYDVRVVADGEAALASLRRHRPDLLLSDVMMPRLDGFGLVRAVRADPALSDLPIVLLSARAGEEASIEGLEAGADDYLIKPFSARELSARIAANLELARLRGQNRKAEQLARAAEERLRAALLASETGTFRWDFRSTIVESDEGLARLFGYPAGQRRTVEAFVAQVHPDDRAAVAASVQQCIDEGADFAMEFRVVHPDGSVRWLYDRGKTFRDPAGQPVAMTGACVDITDRKQAELALRGLNDTLERKVAERTSALEAEMAERQKAEAALQQAQRLEAVGQLTGGVAHDFNNLLTVVMGQAEAITRAAGGNERVVRMATSVQRVAERGAKLTSQLLAFSRRQRLRPETIQVDRLLAGAEDFLRRAVGEAVTVTIEADPALWHARIDPTQFESAVLNLVVNARDAMPGGGWLTIAMRNAMVDETDGRRLDLAAGDYVLVRVSDTGCGMPADVRQRCFEPFFTTKDIGKGTGLGLSQVYGFARQSAGTATVDSVLGQGTTICLYIPRAEPSASGQTVAIETKPTSGAGKSVLVVEDQEQVREVIEDSLRQMGYRILSAPDGVEARKVLEGHEPIDLLLTDVVMPNGVSGIDLARWARKLRQDLKIVLVSGYSRQTQPHRADEGFVFLEKPFQQTDLAAIIATALGQPSIALA
jgi:PAS domain S-box-containing protein